MKAADIDLAAWLEFLPESGQILLNGSRMLIFSQSALGTLNELVAWHLGREFAAAIFTQFGFRCGRDDYASVGAGGAWDTEVDRISSGPVMHMWEGIVHVTPTTLEYDHAAGEFLMAGEWRNSYEAQNHLERHGVGDTAACWTLTGYASGWASEFFGSEVLAVETTCIARGEDLCRFEIRPPDRWDSQADPWRRALVATPESVTSYMEAKVAERTSELSQANWRLAAARDAAERASAVKSRFLANVSHELRTPLNGVIGIAELLRASDLDEEQRDLVDLIVESAGQQIAIVTDILDYTTVESGGLAARPSPVNVGELLSSVAGVFAPLCVTKGHTLMVTPSTDLPERIISDPVMLRQILTALTGNAVKFTPSGGCVELSARQRGADIAMSVRDTGVGMEATRAQAMFEPFVQGDASSTRRHGGTGLGLAIVRQLCNLLDARLEVDTALGEGTTVTVVLPQQVASEPRRPDPAPPAAETSASAAAPSMRTPLRVLIADDNRINAIVITKLLEGMGCRVTSTVDGAEAIEAFDTGIYDLIVLDLHMPQVDGIGVVEHIRAVERAQGADAHLVAALTADALGETRERCLAAGFSEFLTKPLRKDVIAGLVARAADLKARRQR